MYLELDQIQEINRVQLEIFREFVSVCNKLNLKYYMAHGSLLGTIRNNGFFPFDDDIDLLMPRKDFEKLVNEGTKLFHEKYFLQTCKTEPGYPLAFAKMRDSSTAFIQPVMQNYNINQGIYIDIFPLDYYPESRFKQKILSMKEKIYSTRINKRMNFTNKQSFLKKFLRGISVVFSPSWERTVIKRADLYTKIKESSLVAPAGGKGKEKGMPADWFGEGKIMRFEDLDVICPIKTDEYMTRIYGDYMHYNPAAKYMDDSNRVEVSASVYSTTESYLTIKK